MTDYALGDNELAGDRLALLAQVFNPTTIAFVQEWSPASPSLAVDLGCGPGHTTRLLADVAGATRTVGLDASGAFVARARAGFADLEFAVHDATTVPFPVGPADLVFARYLLSHLPDPRVVAERWLGELRPGGRLLIDEVEAIDTTLPTLRTYLEVSELMIGSRGASLYVGRDLAELDHLAGASCVCNRAVPVSPTTGEVARLFSMNLATFRHDPYVVAHVDPALIARLASDLETLLGRDDRGGAVWSQRQVAFERR